MASRSWPFVASNPPAAEPWKDSDRQAVSKAGFDRHLLKPPNPEEIEALLADLG